ncbi:MAG: diaminopimelate epimerase [Firmicutes bacterium]|nr:diaminopimelate epimerase [Bacillota bacterium]
MRFAKMHGLGNDMILINGFAEELPTDLRALARAICDRHLGVGADGLIILTPPRDPQNAALFRFFNSDGSEAGICGNGLRCAALFARQEGLTDQTEFTFETIAGPVKPDVIDEAAGIVRVDMGEPRLRPAEIPADYPGSRVVAAALPVHTRVFYATLVSMGNPHCVIFVDDLDSFPVEKIGPQIEHHALFPEKTNVEFIQLMGDDKLKMRVWERACGETLACGSGACAATVAAVLNGYIKEHAEVLLPYGTLDIKWGADDHVYMTGPAQMIAVGEYEI